MSPAPTRIRKLAHVMRLAGMATGVASPASTSGGSSVFNSAGRPRTHGACQPPGASSFARGQPQMRAGPRPEMPNRSNPLRVRYTMRAAPLRPPSRLGIRKPQCGDELLQRGGLLPRLHRCRVHQHATPRVTAQQRLTRDGLVEDLEPVACPASLQRDLPHRIPRVLDCGGRPPLTCESTRLAGHPGHHPPPYGGQHPQVHAAGSPPRRTGRAGHAYRAGGPLPRGRGRLRTQHLGLRRDPGRKPHDAARHPDLLNLGGGATSAYLRGDCGRYCGEPTSLSVSEGPCRSFRSQS